MEQIRGESKAGGSSRAGRATRNGRDGKARSRRRDDRPTSPENALVGHLGRPGNIEAERNVLGSILLKPDVCDDVALAVRPDDFADEAHQAIYRQLLELHDSGGRIDATILPLSPEKTLPNTTVLSVASLLGQAIKRIHRNESVSMMFQ